MQKKKREKIKSYRVYRQILGQVYHPQIELIPDMRACVCVCVCVCVHVGAHMGAFKTERC